MVDLRHVASTALGLAWRGAVLLVGAAIILGTCSGREPAASRDYGEPGPGGALTRDEDGTPCLTLVVPEGDTNARCVIRDQYGKELMRLGSYSNGSLEYSVPESRSVRATGYRCSNGEFSLGIGSEGLQFEYLGGLDGPPTVSLYSHETRQRTRYRVTPQGRLDFDPVLTH